MLRQCVFLISVVSALFCAIPSILAQTITIALNPKATYLRRSNDTGSLNAPALNLSDMGLFSGKQIRLESRGDWRPRPGYEDDRHGLIGVFSGSDVLLSNVQDQVRDAISAGGTPIVTSNTYYGGIATDIPEDFLISNNIGSINGAVLTIPQGAHYLFVSAFDDLFYDNDDPNSNWQLVITPITVTVSGTVALQSSINEAQSLDFTFRPQGGVPFTLTQTLNASGAFSFNNIPSDTYTVSIKGDKWLRKNIIVDTRNGSVTNVNAMLRAGDANNDNFADIADLLLLIAAYNKVSPASGYSEAADFNNDGTDDINDLLLLIGNYNQMGDS